MPLLPHYTWEENVIAIKVVIDAPGLTKVKSDLLICDTFLRLNFPPYLLQLDLLDHVDDANCSAFFGVGVVTCHLRKVQPVLWGQLTAQGSKQELQYRRAQAQQRLELRLQKDKQARLDQQKAIDKAAVDKRIEIDKQKRDAIEQQKQGELQAQTAEVTSWQESVATQDQAESDYEDDDMVAPLQVTSQDSDQYHGRGWRAKKARGCSHTASMLPTEDAEAPTADTDQQAIWSATAEPGVKEQQTTSEQSSSTAYAEETPVTSRAVDLPPVRSACSPVAVQFTKLETDHLPARETREQEISSYKQKAKETKGLDDNMDISERQPMFLKDRGDTMHKSGNYRAAINAYTKAVEIDGTLSVCYANRAASHLKMQEYRSCIDDCTTALNQMEKAMNESTAGSSASANMIHSSMVKLLTRRAAAYAELHDMQHAQADLQEALKKSPNNENLKADLEEVQACLQPADCKSLRAIADKRFRSQDLQGALEAYSAVLVFPEATAADMLAAASNRAACHLAQHNYSSTVSDCSMAFGLLTGRDLHGSPVLHAWLASEQDHALTDLQKQSLARLLARRGVALGYLRRCDEAIVDLEAAQHVYIALGQQSKGRTLEDDIAKIKQLQASMNKHHYDHA